MAVDVDMEYGTRLGIKTAALRALAAHMNREMSQSLAA